MAASETHQAMEAVFRIERARLIAVLAHSVRDVDRAEELAQEVRVKAFSEWPQTGVPDNPGAWLLVAAKRRAIDAALDDDIGDGLLSLIFTARHTVLSTEVRTALIVRLIGGLTTDEIARAFLASEATLAQRIVRAKKTLRVAGLTFAAPHGRERQARLTSVLKVVYLIINEGGAATADDELIRPGLCAEA